jgi:hypothetical protein
MHGTHEPAERPCLPLQAAKANGDVAAHSGGPSRARRQQPADAPLIEPQWTVEGDALPTPQAIRSLAALLLAVDTGIEREEEAVKKQKAKPADRGMTQCEP